MTIFERIKCVASPGTIIPKPESTGEYRVVKWGKSRGEEALVYSIPARPGTLKPSTKRVTASDFQTAYEVLIKTGEFTKSWFNQNLQACAKDGGCNFTTIGGIFELLGEAFYDDRGVYRKTESSTAGEGV